jgi:hypothetical protein
MYRIKLLRMNVDVDLLIARRRMAEYAPYSPAWDAAMARVEDLEREAWHLDELLEPSARQLVPVGRRSGS